MSSSQQQQQQPAVNMSDYLDFNFGDVLQAPSSPFNFNEYDFPSPSQPHSNLNQNLNPASGPSSSFSSSSHSNIDGNFNNFNNNATASTSTYNPNLDISHSNPISPWTPPGLTYSLTSPEESNSNVSPSMSMDVGNDFAGFSPVLVNGNGNGNNDYLVDGSGNGMFDINNGDFGVGVGGDFDYPNRKEGFQVKREPLSDPQQYLNSFDDINANGEGNESGVGGTVNTADLFGAIPLPGGGVGAGAGPAGLMGMGLGFEGKQQEKGMGMGMGPGFNGSIVFGNEDAGMGDYLAMLQKQQQQQSVGAFQVPPQQSQHQLQQISEDEDDSVNAASPAAFSVASTSSRKASTTTTTTTATSTVAATIGTATAAAAGSKPATKRATGKKAQAKPSRSVSVAASASRDEEDDEDGESAQGDNDNCNNKDRRASEEMDTLPLPAMFGGVKGKGGKKGGGMSSVVLEDGEEAGEEDDWRPSAEEYKKMSSKEKRQLRNKLSARAFRNRRKTYINELEDHIKDRDRLIDAIRNELKNFRSENDELRREIGMMKKAALEPNEELTPVKTPSRSSTAKSSSTSSSSPISTFNPRKDLPTSTSALLNQMSPRSMWGEGAGGYTSVHTTFMPDLALPSTLQLNIPRQNLNPHLNMPAEPVVNKAPHPFKSDGNNLGDSFDAWSAETPFSYRSLEAYRMQLWSRMARDASLAKQGVPVDMRPKFLKEPAEHKAAVIAAATAATAPEASATAAPVLSNVISSAISTRLFSAFLSAFQSPTGRGMDGDRVAAVFTGKAGLKVVDNAPTSNTPASASSTATSRSDTDADAALAASFAHLKVATESLGIKSPEASASTKSLPSSGDDSRSWGFLSRSVVRG